MGSAQPAFRPVNAVGSDLCRQFRLRRDQAESALVMSDSHKVSGLRVKLAPPEQSQNQSGAVWKRVGQSLQIRRALGIGQAKQARQALSWAV